MKKFLILFALIIFLSNLVIGSDTEERKMSLKEAIYAALKNNLDIKIEMTSLKSALENLNINGAAFVPILASTASFSESNRPSSSIFETDVSTSERYRLEMSLEQKIALGGTFTVTMLNERSESSSTMQTVNPQLSTQVTFNLRQPLLKNFGTFISKKNIYIAANDYSRSRLALKQRVMDTVYSVEQAYWNLVYAFQNLEAKKQELQSAEDLLKQNEIKVRVGTAAPMDILDSKAEKASKESEVLQAEISLSTADEELKKVLNLTRKTFLIIPTDQAEVKIIKTDFNKYLLEALQNRPDIASAKLDLKSKNIDVRYYRNQLLPNLEIQASYYTTGQGGKQFLYAPGGDIFNREIIGSLTKDIWDSLQESLANLYKNYSVSLNLTIPLSLARERAELTRAKLSLKRSLLELRKIETTIYSDVKQVLKQLEGNLKLVNANKIRLDLEKAKLKAEEKKFSVGLSTPFNVLQKRRDLSGAQTIYLNSLRSYIMTIAGINRNLARTFAAYDIKFESIEKAKD